MSLGFTGQFKATSPDLSRNGGSYREAYHNGRTSGIQIIPNYPGLGLKGLGAPLVGIALASLRQQQKSVGLVIKVPRVGFLGLRMY